MKFSISILVFGIVFGSAVSLYAAYENPFVLESAQTETTSQPTVSSDSNSVESSANETMEGQESYSDQSLSPFSEETLSPATSDETAENPEVFNFSIGNWISRFSSEGLLNQNGGERTAANYMSNGSSATLGLSPEETLSSGTPDESEGNFQLNGGEPPSVLGGAGGEPRVTISYANGYKTVVTETRDEQVDPSDSRRTILIERTVTEVFRRLGGNWQLGFSDEWLLNQKYGEEKRTATLIDDGSRGTFGFTMREVEMKQYVLSWNVSFFGVSGDEQRQLVLQTYEYERKDRYGRINEDAHWRIGLDKRKIGIQRKFEYDEPVRGTLRQYTTEWKIDGTRVENTIESKVTKSPGNMRNKFAQWYNYIYDSSGKLTGTFSGRRDIELLEESNGNLRMIADSVEIAEEVDISQAHKSVADATHYIEEGIETWSGSLLEAGQRHEKRLDRRLSDGAYIAMQDDSGIWNEYTGTAQPYMRIQALNNWFGMQFSRVPVIEYWYPTSDQQ